MGLLNGYLTFVILNYNTKCIITGEYDYITNCVSMRYPSVRTVYAPVDSVVIKIGCTFNLLEYITSELPSKRSQSCQTESYLPLRRHHKGRSVLLP